MNAIQTKTSGNTEVQPNTHYSNANQTANSTNAVARNFFTNIAYQTASALTRIIGSRKIAESILNGLFAGFVTSVFFMVLRIPMTDPLIFFCVSYYLFDNNFTLFSNSSRSVPLEIPVLLGENKLA